MYASTTARAEFGLAIAASKRSKPTYAEFKERAMLRAIEILKGREPYLRKEFVPFKSYFGQCLIALRKNRATSLETAIEKEYRKL